MRKHTKSKWELLYINRWLKVPFQNRQGEQKSRNAGTPRGGVDSPLLANLFMHYAFDVWVTRNRPQNPWARYADDGMLHCKTEWEAQELLIQIDERFKQVGLELKQRQNQNSLLQR